MKLRGCPVTAWLLLSFFFSGQLFPSFLPSFPSSLSCSTRFSELVLPVFANVGPVTKAPGEGGSLSLSGGGGRTIGAATVCLSFACRLVSFHVVGCEGERRLVLPNILFVCVWFGFLPTTVASFFTGGAEKWKGRSILSGYFQATVTCSVNPTRSPLLSDRCLPCGSTKHATRLIGH